MSILLGTKLRRKLMAYAFSHVGKSFYVRQLAAIIDEDAGNLSRELSRLEKEGIFASYRKANALFYLVNKNYPSYRELKAIVNRTEGVEGALRSVVSGHKWIELAFIYGSFAKNAERANSDIDLVVVGDKVTDKFVKDINKAESKFGREINYTFYEKNDFDEKRRAKGSFLNEVLKGSIVLLKGNVND